MAYQSHPRFRVLHALRVKGFAKQEVVCELADLDEAAVGATLAELSKAQMALFREGRLSAWMLTPAGKAHHAEMLAEELNDAGCLHLLHEPYPSFLSLNERFKALCGDWQLRPGPGGEPAPNDHTDAAYDTGVISRLADLDADAQPIVGAFAGVMHRYAPYAPRLASTVERVRAGETNLFTGVMVGSYHDVWMELHEDLIVTLGIDRQKEGSF